MIRLSRPSFFGWMCAGSILLTGILSLCACDSFSFHQSDEAAITQRMKEKVRRVQIELRQHCDSLIYEKAIRMADSIRLERRNKR